MKECIITSFLEDFVLTDTKEAVDKKNRNIIIYEGYLKRKAYASCPYCDAKMQIHDTHTVKLDHLPLGNKKNIINLKKKRYVCPRCGVKRILETSFQAPGHRMTIQLYNFTRELLSYRLQNKSVTQITGVGRSVVSFIKAEGLLDMEEREVNKTCKLVTISQYYLKGERCNLTLFVDPASGNILHFSRKDDNKTITEEFMDEVGPEFMSNLEAVLCSEGRDFYDVIASKYPHIKFYESLTELFS